MFQVERLDNIDIKKYVPSPSKSPTHTPGEYRLVAQNTFSY